MAVLSLAVEERAEAPLIRFVVPGKPPNWSNSRGHWSARYKDMRDWKERTIVMALEARRPARLPLAKNAPSRRRVEVVIHSARFYDDDGAYASVKPIVDGLKDILIVDDSRRWCEISVRQVKLRHYSQQRVEVLVWELGEGV